MDIIEALKNKEKDIRLTCGNKWLEWVWINKTQNWGVWTVYHHAYRARYTTEKDFKEDDLANALLYLTY